MQPITGYTTYADVRAALGVSEEEIGDDTLGLDLYALGLEADLSDINVALIPRFVLIAATDVDTRTASEQGFYDAVRLFAPYSLAMLLASGLPMFAPKSITDGKASITRDSGSPYKEVIAQANARYERARARLLAWWLLVFGSGEERISFRTLLIISHPNVDPVTGA